MFRKAVKKKQGDHIKWRGQEVTRIEAFSDAVFAFAVTLIIVSLEVPHNFDELMENLRFAVPFGICFAIIFTIWHQQNMFFRRYGLHDVKTIALNGFLLFAVLMYMFPLKFVFGSLFSNKFHFENARQLSIVFGLYCGGFAVFYLLFALMYFHAYTQRDKIRLSDIEAFSTQTRAYTFLIVSIISMVAVSMAFLGGVFTRMIGLPFMFIMPIMYVLKRKRNKLFAQRFGEVADVPVADEIMHAHGVEN